MKILVLEPYFGGSHRTFIDGLQANLPYEFVQLTLPARKWKWRMRLAAPFFAEQVKTLIQETKIEAVLCSSFVDVATLRSLLPSKVNSIPFLAYFHENQFAYPVRQEDERDYHFGLTNLTTVLSSDRTAFNSAHNKQTFIDGVKKLIKICPDMKLDWILPKIEAKSCILHPGIDFTHIDNAPLRYEKKSSVPVIVWNHRWEHDKNPRYFFKTLFELEERGVDFRLIILGQSFRSKPAVFAEAIKKLRGRIIHSGFVDSRQDYGRLLAQGDVIVSTARHEFFGISVIEAVRAGCRPLLPASLSYPELFPAEYLYGKGELAEKLQSLLETQHKFPREQAKEMTNRFSWAILSPAYQKWFTSALYPNTAMDR